MKSPEGMPEKDPIQSSSESKEGLPPCVYIFCHNGEQLFSILGEHNQIPFEEFKRRTGRNLFSDLGDSVSCVLTKDQVFLG